VSAHASLLPLADMNETWHGRKVFDYETGAYLGRADGEPYTDGIEGMVRLRQDEDGQTIKPYAMCAFVVLDKPNEPTDG
jgi:hypothetical protein